MLYHFHSSAWVVTPGNDFHLATMFLFVAFAFLFFFLFFSSHLRSHVSVTVTLRLLAARPVSWCLWRSPLLLQTSLNALTITHEYGQFFHSCVKTNAFASFVLFVFFNHLRQSTQRLYISPKNRLKELCPKECVYKSPINTRTHAPMHANTHARQQCTSPRFRSAGDPVSFCRTRSLLSAS